MRASGLIFDALICWHAGVDSIIQEHVVNIMTKQHNRGRSEQGVRHRPDSALAPLTGLTVRQSHLFASFFLLLMDDLKPQILIKSGVDTKSVLACSLKLKSHSFLKQKPVNVNNVYSSWRWPHWENKSYMYYNLPSGIICAYIVTLINSSDLFFSCQTAHF